MKQLTQQQIEKWREQLKIHQDKLSQAETIVAQETKLISMIEGGIEFGQTLLLQNEKINQKSGTVELGQQSEKAPSKK